MGRYSNLHVMQFAAAAAGIALVLGSAQPGHAQDKTVELKISFFVPPAAFIFKAGQEWAASVEKESKGTIKFRLFPSEQIGKAFDQYDTVRDGIADVAHVTPGYQPGRFPIVLAAELPFMFKDAKGGSRALDAWYRKYAEKEMKDIKYCLSLIIDPLTFHSTNKKIVVPADIKGMKVRPSGATVATWVTSLGGTTIQASIPEVRDVMAKGVADVITLPWGTLVQFGVNKVTKYHMDEAVVTAPNVWVINTKAYAAMSPAQKKVIDEHCTSDRAEKFASDWADAERAGLPKVKATPGAVVYKITAAQLDEWKKSAEPLHKKWADDVKKAGGDPDVIMKDLLDKIAQYKTKQ